MKKNILVPIDFTLTSHVGITAANIIAQKLNANIILMHTIEDSVSYGLNVSADYEAKAEIVNEKEHFLAELTRKKGEELSALGREMVSNQISSSALITVGEFDKSMQEVVEEHNIDMIVMGTTGETSITEFFSGNHASQAIQKLSIPVLAVKEFSPLTVLDRLLLIINFDNLGAKKFRMLKEFTAMLDMELYLAFSKKSDAPSDQILMVRLKEIAENHDLNPKDIVILDEKDEMEDIAVFIKKEKIDVVASVAPDQSFFTRMLFGNPMTELISDLKIPVLAMRE